MQGTELKVQRMNVVGANGIRPATVNSIVLVLPHEAQTHRHHGQHRFR
jgi:hypothetical protein